MGQGDESVLARWSRLKQAQGGPAPEADEAAADRPDAAVPPVAGQPVDTGSAVAQGQEAPPDLPPPDLPPIESLTKESDYTVFMREDVPAELRHLALRKLWQSDPVFANLDGLVEYGEDYSLPWKTGGAVATLYQVGKGMSGAIAKLVEEIGAEPPEDVAAGSAAAGVAAVDPASADSSEGDMPDDGADGPDSP